MPNHRRIRAAPVVVAEEDDQRVLFEANDYVVRNRHYQLLPPLWPGLRKGTVVIEERRDGTMAIRFGDRELPFREIERGGEEKTKTAGESDGSAKAKERRTTGPKESGPRKPPANHPWRKFKIR